MRSRPPSAPAPAVAAVAALGTVLGVWAHPDDEAYLSAGLMAVARDNGQRVVCVTATRGELGTPDPVAWPPAVLAAERTRELAAGLAVLGVHEHRWLPYRDGGCADVDPAEAVARLCVVLDEVRPDTVVTFGPDGMTGHPDHRAVSAWTTAAVARAGVRGVRLLHAAVEEGWARRWGPLEERLGVQVDGEPVTVPAERLALAVHARGALLARKVASLRAQATQTAGLLALLGEEEYAAWVAEEDFAEWPLGRRVGGR